MSTQFLSQTGFQQENINLRCYNLVTNDIDTNGNIEVQDYITAVGNITSTSGTIQAPTINATAILSTPSLSVTTIIATPVPLYTQLTSPTTSIPAFSSMGFIIETFQSSQASNANFKFTVNNTSYTADTMIFATINNINTNNSASVFVTNRQADSFDCVVTNNGSGSWSNTVVQISFIGIEPTP